MLLRLIRFEVQFHSNIRDEMAIDDNDDVYTSVS